MKMKYTVLFLIVTLICTISLGIVYAAAVVPNEIQQPGTQPRQVGNLETPDKCDNCHGGYNKAVEPAFNWRGSMMANAGRDPIFWATLAIAEQDFDGAGDLCIRCHSTGGWYGGRSTPTDGSALTAGDADGVECDTCHKMTNTNNSEHLGVMLPPFIANDELTPATGYYGSGMLSIWGGGEKLGPYSDATARHQFLQSKFHRSVDFCGSCHDVSNPAVGDLAHNSGKQLTADPVIASGTPGAPVDVKAAFNNFPFQYGIVERTFSEYKSGLLSKTLVKNYPSLPTDLKAGAIKAAFDSALGDYADGDPRYFSCQTCHLRAVTGQGCNKNPPVRPDLPLHDMTGGNYWAPDSILYQNAQGTLRLGGGMTAVQIEATQAGKARAQQQLNLAASLSVNSNILKVTNLTAHKLITGYPEGRRMWLNIKWYDENNVLLRTDGEYGPLAVTTPGVPSPVRTILNPADPNTKIYEAHYAMTQEWANQLLGLGYSADLPLSFDRVTGGVSYTLGQLAQQAPGTYHETFHFVLNNHVAKDNRIPTYGMTYDEARKRNALPVPAGQYGNPGAGGAYNYWDTITLNPPAGAVHANIDLLYQSTSWEYIQFLYRANTRTNAFLANEGVNLLNAWLNTGMSEPYVMASATWVTPDPCADAVTRCNDNSACTTDTCDPNTGSCVHTPIVCNDNNVCTTDSCNTATGSCVYTTKNCDDNNICTTDLCVPIIPGGCVHNPNTLPCDDGNACTLNDTCTNSVCAGTSKNCDDNNTCTTDSCNTATGNCARTLSGAPGCVSSCTGQPNGTLCTDNNACTLSDACQNNICVPGTARTCNDNNACTADSCDTLNGCVFTINNTLPCSDGNTCTDNDYCLNGVCKTGVLRSCDDNNPCTDDKYIPVIAQCCVHAPNNKPCNDNNACTSNDMCNKTNGVCAGTAKSCNDYNACTTDSCASATGNCVNTWEPSCPSCVGKPDGSACSDNNACTVDVCTNNVCVSSTPLVCNDNNPCTTDTCNTATGCVFTNNTLSCDDSNSCTVGDVCLNGICKPGPLMSCDDGNVCTTDAAVSVLPGCCVHSNNTLACNDNNACTIGDVCANKVCVPGTPQTCDPGLTCDPATGICQ